MGQGVVSQINQGKEIKDLQLLSHKILKTYLD